MYTKGILSGMAEFGDHERTVYKFRKEFGIALQDMSNCMVETGR